VKSHLRCGRYPRQQWPAFQFVVADRRVFPPEKWEAIIAINLSSAFYGNPRAAGARHEEARALGPYHQTPASAHSLVASPVSSRPMSRPSTAIAGLTKTVGAGACDLQDHLQLHQPPVMSGTPAGRAPRSRRTMKARNPSPRSRSFTTCCWRRSRTKEFVTLRAGRSPGPVLCGDDAAQIHRPPNSSRSRRPGPRSNDNRRPARAGVRPSRRRTPRKSRARSGLAAIDRTAGAFEHDMAVVEGHRPRLAKLSAAATFLLDHDHGAGRRRRVAGDGDEIAHDQGREALERLIEQNDAGGCGSAPPGRSPASAARPPDKVRPADLRRSLSRGNNS